MRSVRQPVGTHGNGFGLSEAVSPSCDLPSVSTTGCDHGAPQRLHPSSSVLATQADELRADRCAWKPACGLCRSAQRGLAAGSL